MRMSCDINWDYTRQRAKARSLLRVSDLLRFSCAQLLCDRVSAAKKSSLEGYADVKQATARALDGCHNMFRKES